MYITTERLKEQVQFMDKQFKAEADQNQIESEYGFFKDSAAQIIQQINNSKIGEGFLSPYICIVNQGGQNQITMGNLFATRIAKNVWSNDRVLIDITSAERNKTMEPINIDLTEYFDKRYEEYQDQPVIDPETMEETEAPKPTFEEFIARLR